jgi:hypothetical protein
MTLLRYYFVILGAAILASVVGGVFAAEIMKKASAEELLASWAAPGSPEGRGTAEPPGYRDLAMENYAVDESFETVWQFYAAKCGCTHEYQAGQNVDLGGGDENSRYLVNLAYQSHADAIAAQCTIAVNSDSHTILIHLSTADTKSKKTYINLIAGIRPSH